MKKLSINNDARAWLVWLLLIGVVCGLELAGNRRSVTPSYRAAATNWVQGNYLYSTSGHGFLYLPAAAILFAPFAALPHVAGEMLWRVLNVGAFAYAISRFVGMAVEGQRLRVFAGRESDLPKLNGQTAFLIATFVAIPICGSAARSGQASVLMTALMLLSAVEVAGLRWWRAAALAAAAVAVKPLAVVLLLLLGAVYPRFRRPAAVSLLAVLAIPFCFQSPTYVLEQYVACGRMLHSAVDLGVQPAWAQPFTILSLLGLKMPEWLQMVVRLAAAGAALDLAFIAVSRAPRPVAIQQVVALAACYLVLFNPRTENSTYAVLAPSLGLAAALAWQSGQRRAALIHIGLAASIVGGWTISRTLVPTAPPVWVAPLAACVFAVILVREILQANPACAASQSPSRAAEEVAVSRRAA